MAVQQNYTTFTQVLHKTEKLFHIKIKIIQSTYGINYKILINNKFWTTPFLHKFYTSFTQINIFTQNIHKKYIYSI
jgi:hypothetical protein